LARGGAALWYNPAWGFVHGFQRVFLRISQGASRLQEMLADRFSAFAYGSGPFERGLRHVIGRSIEFNAHVAATIDDVLKRKRGLSNLYTYQLAERPGPPDLPKAVDAHLQLPPSPYDSHPAPGDRIAWVRALAAPPAAPAPDDELEVWTLIDGREELEKKMTY